MHDLKDDLRRSAERFGTPAFDLPRVIRHAGHRRLAKRVAVIATALVVVSLSGSFLFRAFDPGRRIPPAGPSGVRNGPIAYQIGRLGGNAEGATFAISGEARTIEGILWPGSWSRDGSELVFSRGDVPEGDLSLWTVGSDGSDPVRLTVSTRGGDILPEWSPDGQHLLFIRGNTRIMTIDADGSSLQMVAGGGDEVFFDAGWSPDGTQIVAVRDEGSVEGNPLELVVVNADGSHQRVLVRGFLSQPDWSPDGTEILYYMEGAIRAVTLGDGAVRPVLDGVDPQGLTTFDMSPDASRILFTRPVDPDHGEQLWVASPDGGEPSMVAEGLQWRNPQPTWSPDGTAIAFVRDGDIWTIDLTSRTETQVTDSASYESGPAWGAAWHSGRTSG